MSKVKPLLLAGLTALAIGCGRSKAKRDTIICHVGGTMRPVIEELAAQFKVDTGKTVEINSAGSGELLAHIEMQKSGDVYVCHDPFLDILMRKKLGVDGWTISELVPCIVVQKGNPKHITGLKDLARDEVSVFLTDYKLSTLGRMLETMFRKVDIELSLLQKNKKNLNTNKSGSYVANMVKMKNADAAMCWTAVAALRKDDLDVIELPVGHLPIPFVDAISSATGKSYALTPVRVTAATLKCAENEALANDFIQYILSPDRKKTYEAFGYNVDHIRQEYANGKKYRKRK
jgi:molybdate transport system substrate-binding protein